MYKPVEVIDVVYTNGSKELFGNFDSKDEAITFAEYLKKLPFSMVSSYVVRTVNMRVGREA